MFTFSQQGECTAPSNSSFKFTSIIYDNLDKIFYSTSS